MVTHTKLLSLSHFGIENLEIELVHTGTLNRIDIKKTLF